MRCARPDLSSEQIQNLELSIIFEFCGENMKKGIGFAVRSLEMGTLHSRRGEDTALNGFPRNVTRFVPFLIYKAPC